MITITAAGIYLFHTRTEESLFFLLRVGSEAMPDACRQKHVRDRGVLLVKTQEQGLVANSNNNVYSIL